jgi:hypothetical protein
VTFDSLVSEANAVGLLVNNCFQICEGWQANFRPFKDRGDEDVMVFGRGETAIAALANALSLATKVLAARRRRAEACAVQRDTEATAPHQIDLEEAIAVADRSDIDDLL